MGTVGGACSGLGMITPSATSWSYTSLGGKQGRITWLDFFTVFMGLFKKKFETVLGHFKHG